MSFHHNFLFLLSLVVTLFNVSEEFQRVLISIVVFKIKTYPGENFPLFLLFTGKERENKRPVKKKKNE